MNPAANAGAKCAESVIPSLSRGEAHRICSISSNPLCTFSGEQQRQDACQSLVLCLTGPACQWKAQVLWTADVKFGLTEMQWTQNCSAVTSRVYLKLLKDVFRVSFQMKPGEETQTGNQRSGSSKPGCSRADGFPGDAATKVKD